MYEIINTLTGRKLSITEDVMIGSNKDMAVLAAMAYWRQGIPAQVLNFCDPLPSSAPAEKITLHLVA